MSLSGPKFASVGAVVVFATAALLLFGVTLLILVIEGEQQASAEQQAAARPIEAMRSLVDLELLMAAAETGQRGYLLTGDSAYLQPFTLARDRTPRQFARLRQMFSRDPSQRERLERVLALSNRKFDELRQTIALREAGRTEEALQIVRTNTALSLAATIREDIEQIVAAENRLLEQNREDQKLRRGSLQLLVAGMTALALLSGCAAVVTGRRYANARLRSEAAVERARDQALASTRMKSQFLAAASHDLRQPLHAIHLFVSALKRRVAPGEPIQLVEHIGAAARSMQQMFDKVLDVSKLDAGAVAPNLQPVYLSDLLQLLRVEFQGAAAAKSLALHVPPTDLAVVSDPVLLESVLRNLLSNAIKFTDSGQILVRTEGREDIVTVSIIDTGRGIPKDKMEEVFQEFRRLPLHAGDTPGMGLGLSIVRRLVDLLGHTIDVHSIQGAGSAFHLRMQRTAGASRAEVDNDRPQTEFRGLRVLLVDDDPMVRAATRRELEDWGATVLSGGNMTEAFSALDRVAPDLAVLDLQLGSEETGLQMAAALQNKFGLLPVVILTGATDPELLQELEASGFPWLVKPVDIERLHNVLQTALAPGFDTEEGENEKEEEAAG